MRTVPRLLPRRFAAPAVALACLGLTLAPAYGVIQSTYVDNGNGTFTYHYTVDNQAGTFDIASWSLDLGLASPDWNQNDASLGGDVSVPNSGWLAFAGTPILGLSAQDFLSLDTSSDVLMGATLAGFSFTSAFGPGEVSYFEFGALSESSSGLTTGPVFAAVPDASNPLPMGLAGLAFLAAWGHRRLAGSPR